MTGHDDGESAAIDALYRDPQTYELLAQMTAPADLSFYRALLGDATLSLAAANNAPSLA